SPMFTTRTVDKMAVLRPAQASTSPTLSSVNAVPVQGTAPATKRHPAWRWLGVIAAATALFLIGYSISGVSSNKPAQPNEQEVEEQMARDLRVLDHWNLYQYGDDIHFVEALAQPENFGDEASGH
ncbi:MAG TPA: hypothetical protein VKS79_23420, partial [Gemmataceae bacterium]|nr:hypothetical protein [Gemmataceae bacterium]